jgi:uncharacterized protein YjgD (DUF1641 family)
LPSFLAIYRRQTHKCQLNQPENMQRLRDALEEPARSCVEMLLLTDDAERVMSKLKQNFGNKTAVMNQLQEDMHLFPDVHDSSQFLRLSNLVENIFATVSSFGDENEANHKQVLRKLMNKLPDYLKMLGYSR